MCFFVFILLQDRGQEVLTELFSENGIDLRPDHPACLIRRHRRRLCLKALTDDVSLDSRRSGFNEFRLGMDGLPEDVVSLDRDINLCL